MKIFIVLSHKLLPFRSIRSFIHDDPTQRELFVGANCKNLFLWIITISANLPLDPLEGGIWISLGDALKSSWRE